MLNNSSGEMSPKITQNVDVNNNLNYSIHHYIKAS